MIYSHHTILLISAVVLGAAAGAVVLGTLLGILLRLGCIHGAADRPKPHYVAQPNTVPNPFCDRCGRPLRDCVCHD
jgi:hypothetical protein